MHQNHSETEFDSSFIQRITLLSHALSHPARLQILERLSQRPSQCGDLVGQLPWAQATISQHLKVLREAGLIRGRAQGTKVIYALDPSGIRDLKRYLGELIRELPNTTPSMH
jgi:DNA-binding transcriptional ArsR family regulator